MNVSIFLGFSIPVPGSAWTVCLILECHLDDDLVITADKVLALIINLRRQGK
jgi:hypothetical protein